MDDCRAYTRYDLCANAGWPRLLLFLFNFHRGRVLIKNFVFTLLFNGVSMYYMKVLKAGQNMTGIVSLQV